METRPVSELRVQIQDSAALRLITPEAMQAFVEAHGYRERRPLEREIGGQEQEIAVQYRLPKGETDRYGDEWLLVPLKEDLADYVHRVGDVLRMLSEATGRSQLSLWFELSGTETADLPRIPETDVPAKRGSQYGN